MSAIPVSSNHSIFLQGLVKFTGRSTVPLIAVFFFVLFF